MKAAIYTLGCKVNIYESEYVIDLLKKENYEIVPFEEEADIYIINTCTVTNEADKKDRKIINRAKNKNKDAIIVVMGCYAQAGNDIEADIIIGNKDKSKIIDLIKECQAKKKTVKKIYDLSQVEFENMEIDSFDTHTRAFVKIQDGCNAYCSYCIIPYVRGNIRSKRLEDVLKEVKNLTDKGYKEIVLTGIHSGRYGIDINTNLETLLKELVKIDKLYRIRLSSIEINEITEGIIELMKNNKKIAHHLHIPLQSGSDEILKLMNRKYDLKYFKDKVNYLRREIKDISITTDLIVGFPHESDKLFGDTINFLKEIKFTKIHTFPYSPRKGTKASLMDNQIPENIKKERVKQVLKLSDEGEKDFYINNLNMEYEIITEDRKHNTMGYTSNYIPVILLNREENNKLVTVKLKTIQDNVVLGEQI